MMAVRSDFRVFRGVLALVIIGCLYLGFTNLSFNPHVNSDVELVSPTLALKRQPLNRAILDAELKNNALDFANISERDEKTDRSLNIARLLHERDKRNDRARLYSALDQSKGQDYDKLLQILTPVFGTEVYAVQKQYSQFIAHLAKDDAFFNVLSAKLEDKPAWGSLILQSIAQMRSRPPAQMIRIYELYPDRQDEYIRYAINENEWDVAYEAFLKFSNNEKGNVSVPFNPYLEKSVQGAQPFNWRINTKTAEYLPGKGVLITMFEKKQEWAVSQVLQPMPVGNYALNVNMNGSVLPSGAKWVWNISCRQSGELLNGFEITSMRGRKKTIEIPFNIRDESCRNVLVQLFAHPGLVRRSFEAEVSEVRVINKE